jgi:c-di-GMP-binding flagellar brake protein YcgR
MGIFNRVLHQLSKHKIDITENKTHNRLLAQIDRYGSLIRLQDERQLIEVLIPRYNDSFQSMIMGVDLYNQQLIIDELSPRVINPDALIGETIVLRHQHNRQMLKISSEVLDWEADNRCLLLHLPEQIAYQPRRQHARLSLVGSALLNTTIHPIYGAPWYGSISNISESGMRITVTGDLRGNIEKHQLLRKCEFTLDNGQTISCQGRVKSFHYQGRPYRRTDVSIAFEKISDEDQLSLQQLIEQLSIAA